jgi:O-antigen ligase
MLGAVLGALFLSVTGLTSALKGAAVVAGALVCLVIFLRPEVGLVATVAAIPLDRLGRLGGADVVVAFSVAKILGLVTTAAFVLHLLRRREVPLLPAELIPLAAFVGWGCVTLMYSTDAFATKQAISRLITTTLFLFLCANLLTSKQLLRRTLMAFLIVTFGVGLFSVYTRVAEGYVTSESAHLDDVGVMADAAEEDRVGEVLSSQGATVHPGFYVLALMVAVPLYLFFVETSRTVAWRLFWLTGTGLALINLFLTQRRSGVFALTIIGLFMLVKRLVRPHRFLVFGFIALAFISVFFVPSTFWERVFSIGAYSPERSHNVRARIELVGAAKEILSEHWLLGVGLFNQREVLRYTDIVQTEQGASVHNAYLQTWIESGVVGLCLLLSLLYWFWSDLSRAEKACERDADRETKLLIGFLKASFLAPVVLGLTGVDWNIPMRDWWFICAAAIFLSRTYGRSKTDSLGEPRAQSVAKMRPV